MRYLLTILILAAPLSSGAASANVCDVSDIIDCSALAKAPVDLSGTQGFPKFKDGRQIFNVLAALGKLDSPEFLQSQEPTPKQLKDFDKTVGRIKERVRGFLKAGRSDEWVKESTEPEAAELRAILARLDAVKIRISNEEDFECSIENPSGIPNAFRDSIRNKIVVCPASAKQSLPWLTHTIAHELGHAIGPCAMDLILYKIKPGAEMSASSCFESQGDSENVEVDRNVTRLLKSIRTGEVTSVVTTPSFVGRILSCGLLEETPKASVPRENRKMFGRAPECIDLLYKSEYEKMIQEGAALEILDGKTNVKAAEDKVRSEIPQTCYPKANEHFADTFAAKFTAHVAEEDHWSKTDIRISMINEAVAACAAQANRPFIHPLKYPTEATRLSVYMNEDIFRDRLNCVTEPKPEKLCSLSSPKSVMQRSGSKPTSSSTGTQ